MEFQINRRAFLGTMLLSGLSEFTAKSNSTDGLSEFFIPPNEWKGKLGNYRSPLIFNDESKVETLKDWSQRRIEIRNIWMQLMGQWPKLIIEPKVMILSEIQREDFRQLKVRFKWTPVESTTGYLLIPNGKGKRPAVVTVYYEPESAVGLKDNPFRDYAMQLARRGFVTLSIGSTETTNNRTYATYYPSIENATVQPLSMLGCAAANAWHVLAQRPEVDADRIGIVGHSYGGKWAMFASCLFEKFACAAWSDPGIVFDTRPSVNYWEPWYLGYHPKPWRKRGVPTADNPARGLYPKLLAAQRDLHELHALMAPRPFLVSGGSEDPPQRWEALNHTIAVNDLLGVQNRVAMTNRPKHAPTAESNAVIYEFFERFLKG
ncbi:MAG: alpha/beta hydrolase family protein [Limisphaerales bacterium]